jgi:hypothetical protein
MYNRHDKEEAFVKYLIDVYRQLISDRYQYESLKKAGVLSDKIDKKIVDSIRTFFLNDVYPDFEKRKHIEEAFETLGSYVTQPAKALGLFGSVTSAIFMFGRHLPAAINAGIVTLQSFVDARHLEEKFIYAAKENFSNVEFTTEEMKQCIVQIPKADLEKFINDVKEMFLLMSNVELLEKTIRIMDMVIDKMKSKPKLYSKQEVEGIVLGRNILVNGLKLFKNYPDSLKKEIAETIYRVEMSYADELYSTYKY